MTRALHLTVIAIGMACIVASAADENPPPLELRLDRDYYTSERVARVRAEHRTKTGPLAVELTITGPGEKGDPVISERLEIPAGPPRDEIWSLDIAKLTNGTYSLAVKTKDSSGRKYDDFEMPLVKHAPAEHEVKYDWNNTIIVDGKPFFPIGYLGSSVKEVAIKKAQGFNSVVEWPFPGVWEKKHWPTQELLDEAHKNGMQVILLGPYNRHGPGKWGLDRPRDPS